MSNRPLSPECCQVWESEVRGGVGHVAKDGGKMLARKQYLDELIASRDADTSHFCNFVQNDAVQRGLGSYLDKLKQKSKVLK